MREGNVLRGPPEGSAYSFSAQSESGPSTHPSASEPDPSSSLLEEVIQLSVVHLQRTQAHLTRPCAVCGELNP